MRLKYQSVSTDLGRENVLTELVDLRIGMMQELDELFQLCCHCMGAVMANVQ